MIKVNKDSSLAAALEIDEIVSSISDSMATLDENIRKNIPDRINTDWANEFRASWQKYYTTEIEEALMNIKKSGIKLRKAVKVAIKYSKVINNE